jgi:hypothetical protein
MISPKMIGQAIIGRSPALVVEPSSVYLGHRIAVERNDGLFGGAAQEFSSHAIAQLDQRPGDLLLRELPIRIFGMPAEIGPQRPRPLANPRGLGPQFGIGHHFFDIAEPIGPLAKAFAGERGAPPLVAVARSSFELGPRSVSAMTFTIPKIPAARTPLSLLSVVSALRLAAASSRFARLLALLRLALALTLPLPLPFFACFTLLTFLTLLAFLA